MSKTNEQRWQENYDQLKAYVLEHHQLPNKKKAENRGLLNWWKYNQRLIRQGKLSPSGQSGYANSATCAMCGNCGRSSLLRPELGEDVLGAR